MPDVSKRLSPAGKLSHFRNLVVMALKDGKLAAPERDMLTILANKWGLTPAQASEVLGKSDRIALTVPKDEDTRFQQLFDITEMMIIDGVVGAKEKELCAGLAKELGFDRKAIDVIIEEILSGNRLLRSEDQIQGAIRSRLKRK